MALLVSVSGCAPRVAPPWAVHRDRAAAQQFNEQGLALLEAGRTAEAEETLRRALDEDPYLGPAHCNLGVALLQLGKPYNAGVHLRWATKLMPKASQPRANLGILYETVGRYGPAEEHLRAALKLSPDDIEIIGQLARVHVHQNKHTPETLSWLQTVAANDNDQQWRAWAGQQLIRLENKNSIPGR